MTDSQYQAGNELRSHQQRSLIEERVSALFKGIPLSIAASAALDLLLTVSHWRVIGEGELILWNILMLCTMALRLFSWYFWCHTEATLSAKHWLIIFRTGTLLAGLTWGSSAFFIFASHNTTYQALLAFTLAGMASGSLTSLAIDRISSVGFISLAIIPLSVRLHAEQGEIAYSMSFMVALFIVFVLSASARARKQLEESFEQNNRLIEWGNERLQQQHLSKILNHTQSLFITSEDESKAFDYLLENIISLTESQFGFIAEVANAEEKHFQLNMLSLTNISWDKESQSRYNRLKTEGMTFTNPNTLFGVAVNTNKVIISNNPAGDMRAGGTPKGHPPLTSFIGIPVFHNTRQVALLGLANRLNGYDDTHTDYLKPVVSLISQCMMARAHRLQHAIDEDNLKRQAKHTQAILDGVFEAIITVNEQGIIMSFNNAAEVIFGYRSAQIIGQSLTKLLPERYRYKYQAESIKNLTETFDIEQETRGLRKSGKEFDIELTMSLIPNDPDIAYVAIVRDISDRKQTEKLKNEFIATVSHELRTPLTSISASLAIIESGSLGPIPEKVNNLVKIANQNSLRLQSLVGDLLDMDRLLTNKMEFKFKKIDSLIAVEKCINSSQHLADRHNIKFQITSVEANCYLLADENRFQQAINQLLSNAVKFSPPNSNVAIAITKDSANVKISVTDVGTGIAPEFKAKIFKAFTQEDSSSSRQKSGSGLGLSISKELIEKMGGNIGFTSELGKGSTFYIEMPIAH